MSRRRLGAVTTAVVALALWGIAFPPAGHSEVADDVVLRALSDELERSMAELRVEGLESPYFIAYRVDDIDAISVSASFGSGVSNRENRSRLLTVEVRVGSYQLDNTNFLSLSSLSAERAGGRLTPITLDDDYQEIRRQVWLATDRAYKAALEQLAQKQSVLQNKTLAEDLDDFGRAEPTEGTPLEAPVTGPIDTGLESLVVELSEEFRAFEALFDSYVSVVSGTTVTTFVNSEGSRYRTATSGARLIVEASTQAEDGMPLNDRFLAVADTVDELPSRKELALEVAALGARLSVARGAELLERYNGPVLFAPQAAAELLAQGLVPLLLTQREPLVGDERLTSFLARAGAKDFKDRIGARILPRFMAITDDPLRESHGDERLLAGYGFDDQGVPARTTALVERGYLKTLLAGRTPVAGVEKSTGNWRGGGVMPSNLIVSATRRTSEEELRKELMLLVADRGAEFGVIIRRMGPSSAVAAPGRRRSGSRQRREPGEIEPAVVALKVYPDGREVRLRNVELPGFSATAFKDIIAVGPEDLVYTTPFLPRAGNPFSRLGGGASFGGFGGPPVTTFVVPALLFEEVTLKKPGDEIPSLPVASHPYFEAGY